MTGNGLDGKKSPENTDPPRNESANPNRNRSNSTAGSPAATAPEATAPAPARPSLFQLIGGSNSNGVGGSTRSGGTGAGTAAARGRTAPAASVLFGGGNGGIRSGTTGAGTEAAQRTTSSASSFSFESGGGSTRSGATGAGTAASQAATEPSSSSAAGRFGLDCSTFVFTPRNRNPPAPLPLHLVFSKHVLEKLPFTRDLLNYRLVCKEWNEIFCQSSIMNEVVFNVKNCPESIQVLRDLSPTFPVKYFRFHEINIEAALTGHPEAFQKFVQHHSQQLNAITLYNCQIPKGRFFELIALCPNLKYLATRSCPSMFEPDMGIFRWGHYSENLKKNLSGLKKLTMVERQITNTDLFGLTLDMKDLTFLHISTMDSLLPRNAIFGIIKNNFATIRELVLGGDMFDDGFFVDEAQKILAELPEQLPNLYTLKLVRGHYRTEAQSDFVIGFLNKCPKLKEMTLSEVKLKKNLLLHLQDALTHVNLINCGFWEGTVVRSPTFPKLKELMITQDWSRDNADADNLGSSIECILSCQMPSLESLMLSSIPNGPYSLQGISPAEYPKLKELHLNNIRGIGGVPLQRLMIRFPNLELLDLSECDDLNDDSFCNSLDTGGKPLLNNFKNLRSLNLAKTKIGNRTVLECICSLQNLEYLSLNETQVDNDGFDKIISILAREPCKLKELKVRGTRCNFTLVYVLDVVKRASHLNLVCDVVNADPNLVGGVLIA